MRQQDYKMVQGVNQVVQMSPQIAGATARAAGMQGLAVSKGIAQIGQALAKTGQDISNIMLETQRANDETLVMQAKNKWREGQLGWQTKMEENSQNPLDWGKYRDDGLEKLQQFNATLGVSNQGRRLLESEWTNWRSQAVMDVDRSAHKRVFTNRNKETVIALQQHYNSENPLGIQQELERSADYLDPEVAAMWQTKMEDLDEQIIFNDFKAQVKDNPKQALEDMKDLSGNYAHYKNDPDSIEKLEKIARAEQGLIAREQADNLDAAIYDSPSFSTKDLDKMVERGELDQFSDGNLAKLRSSIERKEPITSKELMEAYKLLGQLEADKSSMTPEEYIVRYNDVSSTVKSKMPAKAVGWVMDYLDDLNPMAKPAGGTDVEKSRTRNKREVSKLVAAAYGMGEFAELKSGYEMRDLDKEEQARAAEDMRDVEYKLQDWINSEDRVISVEEVREKMGHLIGAENVKKARASVPYVRPQQSKRRNRYIPTGSYQSKVNVPASEGAANVRYNNPAAAYPRKADEKYGVEGYGIIGGGHKIAKFPTPVHGAAANFDLFSSNYVGMTFKDAMRKWRGRPSPVPKGYKSDDIIDENFLNDPDQAIDFFKKMALHESPQFKGMSDDDWRSAWEMWKENS